MNSQTLEETKEALNTERKFLEVICRDFTAVYYVDLIRNTVETLKIELNANASRIARIKLREQGSYMESMKEYCENMSWIRTKMIFLNG